MKTNYVQHLAWFEHTVRPKMITASSHKTRCWYGSLRERPLPYELMRGYSKNTTMRKRPRLDDASSLDDPIVFDVKLATTVMEPVHNPPPNLTQLKRSSSDMTVYYDAQSEWQVNTLESQVETLFKTRFEDRPFVPNQLESMIAAIHGQDVFLVLPLGPLRHVCYMLPAIYQAQKTTVVIMPTMACLQDMHHAITIEAVFVSSVDKKGYVSLDQLEQRLLLDHDVLPLVYITQDDFRQSRQLMYDLYRRHRLARFVVEEAHCISPWWSTDFSLPYSRLAQTLREIYTNIPITALTAIPQDRIQHDIQTRLGIQDCRVFKKSILL